MKVLMLPSDYLPHSVGGREIYTHGLALQLQEKGHDVAVAFHVCYGRPEPGSYTHEGIQVHALPPIPDPAREEVYSCRPRAIPGYRELVQGWKPDIVHLHDFGWSVSLSHLEVAKESGARTVMTYHSPGQSCLQRSLMYKGRTPCDGRLDLQRCTECRLVANGAPGAVARAASGIDAGMVAFMMPGPLARVATARKMTREFMHAWQSMASLTDRFHVFAEWVERLALTNGVPAAKVMLARTGLPFAHAGAESNQALWPTPREKAALRAVYWGRIDAVKGVATLVDAVKGLPRSLGVEVLIIGGGSEGQERYRKELEERAGGHPGLVFTGRVPPRELPNILKTADVAVIPSLWLETGPLTVLEAWAAGLPVVGSRLGGIAELVKDGIDGELFTPGDATGLAAMLRELAVNPARVQSLRERVPFPRTMGDVSRDIIGLYEGLLS